MTANPSYPEFVERMPWRGGDLQSLRNQYFAPRRPLDGRETELVFATSDGSGDRLTGKLNTPACNSLGPTVLLIHGLTGCEDSTYMRETARFQLSLGRPVVRINLRGAGPSRSKARGFYFGGCTQDVQDIMDGLDPELTGRGVFAIGYSLGGNILINFLAGLKRDHPVVGAATVSAPIRPAEACERLMAVRNSLYHHFLLRRMKAESLSPHAQLSSSERQAIEAASSIFEFDDKFTAPRHGYADAEDYYTRTAGFQFVGDLPVPTLLLHARNDPWIPDRPYQELQQRTLGLARICLTRSGGHVGFHDRASRIPWHDRTINRFLEEIVAGMPGLDQPDD